MVNSSEERDGAKVERMGCRIGQGMKLRFGKSTSC